MLKKISAALIAVSMLAAPAMAASTTKTQTAPINTPAAPAAKQAKSTVLNANAKMGRHHHKHMGALKTHKFSKASIKHVAPATKRG